MGTFCFQFMILSQAALLVAGVISHAGMRPESIPVGRAVDPSVSLLLQQATIYEALLQANGVSSTPISCIALPHGSFDDGFDGWSTVPLVSDSGAASEFTDAAIVSGVPLIVPMDAEVARLWIGAFAYGPDGQTSLEPGSASAELILSTTSTVMERYLRFTLAGGWEATFFAEGTYGLDARVEIESARGAFVSHHISEITLPAKLDCDHGLAVFGILSLRDPLIVMDVLEVEGKPTGIVLGESVTIRIVLSASVAAAGACDVAELTAVVHVDEFAFCGSSASGDLDRDGAVDGTDLALLLGQWGSCPLKGSCSADLDGNGIVNGLDLAILLGEWTS